jgi:hypothetical protein
MAYKQKQSSCAKMVDAKGKPSGLMMAGSAYHMEYSSPAKKTDPKDGVVVTGTDKSKSAKEAHAERKAKRDKEMALKKEKRAIARANLKEEVRFKQEEKKAAAAAKRQRAEQKKKKAQGRIASDAEDTSTNYMRGPLNQNDPKDGGSTNMKDLSLGSKARYDEYNKRGWMHDETTLTPKSEKLMRQTDLRKTSNFPNVMDRNRVPVDKKKYQERKKKNASVTDLFTSHSGMLPQDRRVKLPEGVGYSGVNQRINDHRK